MADRARVGARAVALQTVGDGGARDAGGACEHVARAAVSAGLAADARGIEHAVSADEVVAAVAAEATVWHIVDAGQTVL